MKENTGKNIFNYNKKYNMKLEIKFFEYSSKDN